MDFKTAMESLFWEQQTKMTILDKALPDHSRFDAVVSVCCD